MPPAGGEELGREATDNALGPGFVARRVVGQAAAHQPIAALQMTEGPVIVADIVERLGERKAERGLRRALHRQAGDQRFHPADRRLAGAKSVQLREMEPGFGRAGIEVEGVADRGLSLGEPPPVAKGQAEAEMEPCHPGSERQPAPIGGLGLGGLGHLPEGDAPPFMGFDQLRRQGGRLRGSRGRLGIAPLGQQRAGEAGQGLGVAGGERQDPSPGNSRRRLAFTLQPLGGMPVPVRQIGGERQRPSLEPPRRPGLSGKQRQKTQPVERLGVVRVARENVTVKPLRLAQAALGLLGHGLAVECLDRRGAFGDHAGGFCRLRSGRQPSFGTPAQMPCRRRRGRAFWLQRRCASFIRITV